LKAGIVEERWPLSSRDSHIPAWKDAPNKAWEARRMEVYAAQIHRMDRAIGRILQQIEDMGAAENTLVLFLADNGGCHVEMVPARKGDYVPKITRDGRPVQIGNDPNFMPGPETTFQSYGRHWANASNTPFRLYKSWVHEGGISTPLIARWPGIIAPNRLEHQVGHVSDIMATCVSVSGARYPREFNGNRITPLSGEDLAPVLKGGRRKGHDFLYWEHEGSRAYRTGNWKAVAETGKDWELYDIDADRTELNNLAQKEPGRLRELTASYERIAQAQGVVPWSEIVRRRRAKAGR